MRLLVLTLALLAAGCAAPAVAPQNFQPANYAFLTPLRFNVGTIDIDANWQPASGDDLGADSPLQPVEALRRMAEDRLSAGGSGGRLAFHIRDASLQRLGNQLSAHFSVNLEITGADGTRGGYADARVARTLPLTDTSPAGLRQSLYTLTRQTMDDMNVELEYQVRRTLSSFLIAAVAQDSGSAVQTPVQQQSLMPPSGATSAPLPDASPDNAPVDSSQFAPSQFAPSQLAPSQLPPPQPAPSYDTAPAYQPSPTPYAPVPDSNLAPSPYAAPDNDAAPIYPQNDLTPQSPRAPVPLGAPPGSGFQTYPPADAPTYSPPGPYGLPPAISPPPGATPY